MKNKENIDRLRKLAQEEIYQLVKMGYSREEILNIVHDILKNSKDGN